MLGAGLVLLGIKQCPTNLSWDQTLRYYSAHADDYDLLFVGSSHVRHEIEPHYFDESLLELTGQKRRSFAIGVNGALGLPIHFLVKESLSSGQPPTFIFIDALVAAKPLNYPPLSPENVMWHTPEITYMAAKRHWLDGGGSVRSRRDRIVTHHVMPAIARFLQLGMGVELRPFQQCADYVAGNLKNQGHYPFPGEGSGIKSIEEWSRVIADLKLDADRRSSAGEIAAEQLNGLISFVRQKGSKPIFIEFPTTDSRDLINDLIARNVLYEFEGARVSLAGTANEGHVIKSGAAPILRYNAPELYPHLFRYNERHDRWHLEENGRRKLIAEIARDFAALSGAEDSPQDGSEKSQFHRSR